MGQHCSKVAIVTGASSGIGYETAKLFAREGAKVVAAARREPELAFLVAEIERDDGEAAAVAAGVQDEPLAERLLETALGRFGGLDIAFNNAYATGDAGAVPELSPAARRETIETSLISAFLGARQQIPAMLTPCGVTRCRSPIPQPSVDRRTRRRPARRVHMLLGIEPGRVY